MKLTQFTLGLLCCLPLMLAGCSSQTQSTSAHSKQATSTSEATTTSKQASQAQSASANTSASSTSATSATSNASTSQNSHAQANQTQLSSKQIGTLVVTYAWPETMKTGLAHPDNGFFYGTVPAHNSDWPSQVVGYQMITMLGDPTSYLYYKPEGDQVTYWMTEIPQQPLQEHHVKLQRLINDYYQTPQQQQEINNFANQLKPVPLNGLPINN